MSFLHLSVNDGPQLLRPPLQLGIAQRSLRVEPIEEQVGDRRRVIDVPILRHHVEYVPLREGERVHLAHYRVHDRAHRRDDLAAAHAEPGSLLVHELHRRGREPLAPLHLLLEEAERGLVAGGAVLGRDEHAQDRYGAVVAVGDVVEVSAEDVEAVQVQELRRLLEREVRKCVGECDVDPVMLFVVIVEEGVLSKSSDEGRYERLRHVDNNLWIHNVMYDASAHLNRHRNVIAP